MGRPTPAPRCTAIVAGGHRCARAPIVRDFTTALYPDGPAIRLCREHERRWYQVMIGAARILGPTESGARKRQGEAMVAYERMADAWRWASDCAGYL